MTAPVYALVGLTGLVAALVAVVTFAVLRVGAAARDNHARVDPTETVLLYSALQDAVAQLKAQERATAARADASERLSSEIIASLTAGLLVVGLDEEVRILNPAGRRILDVPDEGEYARSAREQPLFALIEACIRGRSAIVRRSVSLPAIGGGILLGVTVSPLCDADGQPYGAICLFSDLTTVRDLEEQLRLKDGLAAVGELTAGIAHEFRNGLATIHGYSKLIDPQAMPEAYRPYVEGIRAETQSLSEVVTNFLNFARPAQLTLTSVDLRAVCERAADDVRADARMKGGDIDVVGNFVAIEGDEVLLRQAFANLIRNGVEACAGASRAPRIRISAQTDATQRVIRIAVEDDGPGIPSAAREQVFRPFFTSKRNGTGLGLALVQKIIVFHNGRISVGASPEGGASLQVTLPLA